MMSKPTREQILIIDLNPHESDCCMCGAPMIGCRQGIPMFEGEPVAASWGGDWAGYDACLACFNEWELTYGIA